MSFVLLTLGLYGGSRVMLFMAAQSCPLNQLCFLIFSVPPFFIGIRSVGSFLQSPLTKSSQAPLSLGG